MLRGLVSAFFFLGLVILEGCSSSEIVRISGQMYFPLRVGNYFIYKVSETDIQNTACYVENPPPKIYQLKVLIYDSVKNAEGGYTYHMHRYTRPDSAHSWGDLDTWSARVTANQVIVNEGNTPYVKFSFPLIVNSKWNGNQYNNLAEEDYVLKNDGQPYQLDNGAKYPATLTVVQSDNEDFYVYFDKRIEIYAATIGLIYKETTKLTYIQTPCYGSQSVRTGIIYKQSLIGYGRE